LGDNARQAGWVLLFAVLFSDFDEDGTSDERDAIKRKNKQIKNEKRSVYYLNVFLSIV
jgi:hypothetical protein